MIYEDLLQSFYILISGSSFSPFSLFPCVSVCYFIFVVFYNFFLCFLFFLCYFYYFQIFILGLPLGLRKKNDLYIQSSFLFWLQFFSICASSALSPSTFTFFLFPQIISFYFVCLFPNYSSSLFKKCSYSFNFYVIILIPYPEIGCNFLFHLPPSL